MSRKRLTTILIIASLLASGIYFEFRGERAKAATALEFYSTSTTSVANFTGAYADYISLTVDRSGEAGSKDFIIISHMVVGRDAVSDTTTAEDVRFRQDNTTDLMYWDNDFIQRDDITDTNSNRGQSYSVVKKVTLSNTSYQFDWEVARVAGANNVVARNASIAVLEEPTNAQYAERTTQLCHSSVSWLSTASTTFTPATEEQYLFVWAAERMNSDESDSDSLGTRIINTTDTITYGVEQEANLLGGDNDDKYWPVGGAFFETVETSSHTYDIQIYGGGTGDDACIRNAAIVAFPASAFENVYTSSFTATEYFTGTTFTDSTASTTVTVNAAPHLAVAGVSAVNENISQIGYWKFVASSTEMEIKNFPNRAEVNPDWWLQMATWAGDMEAGSATFKIQGNSDSTDALRQGAMATTSFWVAEIPEAAAAAATPTPTTTIIKGDFFIQGDLFIQ